MRSGSCFTGTTLGPRSALSSAALTAAGAGVCGVVDFRQVLKIQVRVDLCGGDVGVPQQFLDAAQIRTGFEQMGGKRMPEHVRMHMHFQAHAPSPGIHSKLDRTRRETPSATADENGGAVAPGKCGALSQPCLES